MTETQSPGPDASRGSFTCPRPAPRLGRVLATVLGVFLAGALAGGCDDAAGPTITPPPVAPTPDPPPPDPGLRLPDDPGAVILEIWTGGGFVPIEFAVGAPPTHWLTAGGTLYSAGPILELWPPFLLPNLLVTELSDEQQTAVHAAIAAAGLPDASGDLIREPTGLLVDASTTEVVFRNLDGDHSVSVYGLGARSHTDPRVPLLEALLDELGGATEQAVPYRGNRVQVIVGFGMGLPDPQYRNDRPWPLPDPPGAMPDGGFACLVFEEDTALQLLEEFRSANIATLWRWNGEAIYLFARALFPGEPGCREG